MTQSIVILRQYKPYKFECNTIKKKQLPKFNVLNRKKLSTLLVHLSFVTFSLTMQMWANSTKLQKMVIVNCYSLAPK